MSEKIIAYDLGTGGNKASLYDSDGICIESTFVPYQTIYPKTGWHEQRPIDWWNVIVESTKKLLSKRRGESKNIACVSISGHSLGVIPVDRKGNLLRSTTPIWSDTRPENQVKQFFDKVDKRSWYMTTGNGFPSECYSVFKIMWYRDNEPEMFKKIFKIVGTKDFINLKLTGNIVTDYSYASGSGVYDLKKWAYSPLFIQVAGLDGEIFPPVVPSTHIVGELTKEAAEELELPQRVKVLCGGVDNSCMALGAGNISEGRVYTSLGSSAWVAVSSANPVVDFENMPFVFTHVIPGMFTSAVSIFSAGSTMEWVKDTLCEDLLLTAKQKGKDIYEMMNELADTSPPGSRKLLFNPSLAGGTSQEHSPYIRGALSGIDLRHTRSDIIRSCMEGIALNLSLVLEILRNFTSLSENMVIVGGGSKSALWCQIFADTYNMNIIKTNIGQEAGSLGAAAVAAVGTGLWKDFSRIDEINKVIHITKPIPENVKIYNLLKPVFDKLRKSQSTIGELLHKIEIY